jgi:hypothetical protein
MDRRESNGDLNGKTAVKTFEPSQSGSFGRIRLPQNGPNQEGADFRFSVPSSSSGRLPGCSRPSKKTLSSPSPEFPDTRTTVDRTEVPLGFPSQHSQTVLDRRRRKEIISAKVSAGSIR